MGTNEVAIIAIEPNGPVEKRPAPWGGKTMKWFAPVIYILSDGRRLTGTKGSYSRKMDAVEAQQPRSGIENMAATFDDNGEFYGTRTRYDTLAFLTNQARL